LFLWTVKCTFAYVSGPQNISDGTRYVPDIEQRFNKFFANKVSLFKVKTGACFDKAKFYLRGLYTTEKTHRNIEKMTDGYPGEDYYKIQHFISESPWSAKDCMASAAQDVNALFAGHRQVALIIDESGEEKKGTKSVGVGHQYCGNLGKTCNSQVAVFAALASGGMASIIDARLYLPKSWAGDPERCKAAHIPKADIVFKTKTELALEIIVAQRAAGVRFDWINADGLYGNDSKLLNKLDELGELYVIDIHSNQTLFLEPFVVKAKDGAPARGRKPTKPLPDKTPVRADKHIAGLDDKDWEKAALRDGTKGVLKVETYVKQVYVPSGDGTCAARLLIASRKKDGKGKWEHKYSISNAKQADYTVAVLAYMQCHRFWVEHAFREAKQELGLTDYQVRGWLAWHHHMALAMMAMAFTLSEKMAHKDTMPLLSASDVRLLLLHKFAETSQAKLPIEEQIRNRHLIRQKDIDNRYKRE
jgi:SRSO17 transposase